jgi:hypothetical protein
MSKPNASLAVLATLLLSLPLVAATISEDRLELKLSGPMVSGGGDLYKVEAGSMATVELQTLARRPIWIFAVAEDAFGQADYGNPLTLFYGRTEDGHAMASVEVPKGLEGMTFRLDAIVADETGKLHFSNEVTVLIPKLIK